MKRSSLVGSVFLLAIVFVAALASRAASTEGCRCCRCGNMAACKKICRLICEEKKVNVTCFGVLYEDFCVPGPSGHGCQHCETVCNDCNTDPKAPNVQAGGKPFVWFEYSPTCASTLPRAKLMKKTITKTVPNYKWVVETVCCGCEPHCTSATPVAGAQLPPQPALDARTQLINPYMPK